MLSLLVLSCAVGRWAAKESSTVSLLLLLQLKRHPRGGGRLDEWLLDSRSLRPFPSSETSFLLRVPGKASDVLVFGLANISLVPSYQIGYCERPSSSLYTVQLLTWGQACPTWCPAPTPSQGEGWSLVYPWGDPGSTGPLRAGSSFLCGGSRAMMFVILIPSSRWEIKLVCIFKLELKKFKSSVCLPF